MFNPIRIGLFCLIYILSLELRKRSVIHVPSPTFEGQFNKKIRPLTLLVIERARKVFTKFKKYVEKC